MQNVPGNVKNMRRHLKMCQEMQNVPGNVKNMPRHFKM